MPDGKRPWWSLFTNTLKSWNKHNGNVLSAAMAYYASFSMFPLCLILMAGFGYISRVSSRVQSQQRELLDVVQQNAGNWLAERLAVLLSQVESQAKIGGPLGLLALTLTAIGLFTQLERIFDSIWDVPPPPTKGWIANAKRLLRTRAVGLLMLLGVGLAVSVIFLLNIVLSALRPYAVDLPAGRYAWRLVQMLVTLALNSALLMTIYRTLPRVSVRWKEAAAGGLFVAVLWQFGQQLLELFVIGDKYNAYGVIGSFIAVMLWMYYACSALFLGAEFVQEIQLRRLDVEAQRAPETIRPLD
jgi:membrane protein